MNINLLSLSNNKKSSHICVKYGSEDVYTAGKSANCHLAPSWAQFIPVAGQRLYTIQRRRPISATQYPTSCSKPDFIPRCLYIMITSRHDHTVDIRTVGLWKL